MAKISYFNCKCYITHNIYIEEYDMHFNFYDSVQFFKDYNCILVGLGCDNEQKRSLLLQKVTQEVERRKKLDSETRERKELLEKLYKPLDFRIYSLQETFFDPNFKLLVNTSKELERHKILPLLDIISEEKQIYGFPVFTEDFCARFLNEINHYGMSDLPKGRPNSMNKYGVLLDEIGFHESFSQPFREKYLDALSAALFPEWRGDELDSHKIFSVGYKIGEDVDLGYHYDNSEVTLNVCLGKSFTGGELYFGDFRTQPISQSTCITVPHTVGYGILHRGQQLHGALPITSGERHNLVFWLRSSSIRNRMCPMCNSKPKLVSSSGCGDGFTSGVDSVQVCSVT